MNIKIFLLMGGLWLVAEGNKNVKFQSFDSYIKISHEESIKVVKPTVANREAMITKIFNREQLPLEMHI